MDLNKDSMEMQSDNSHTQALLAEFKQNTPNNPLDTPAVQCSTRFRVAVTKRAVAGVAAAVALLLIFVASSWIPDTGCIHGMVSPGRLEFPSDGRIDPVQVFLNIPSTEMLSEHLQYYSSGTHVAGINHTQATYTRDYFEAQGIDAKIVEYFPWLNYPVSQRVVLFNETSSKIIFEASLKEDILSEDPLTEDPNNLPAFHGYSADGNVTGQLVYANYGSIDDFQALDKAGISVSGKIVLVRYGGVFRGIKVHAAELRGARGVLIYSDPADDGYSRGETYPNGPWRPDSSIQRGSVMRIQMYPGDPLTPGYASTADAPRIDPADAKNINHIPSLPLSYRDAQPLLRALQGHGKNASDIGKTWVGGLTSRGVEYWTGPSELSVNLLNKVEYKETSIQNVIGKIKGSEDSEHAVILGNHRDAWCAGASDPSSGSAALLELARALGELMKLGWRPRRTIILASWDAEEYGLVGSTEWVEEKIDWLRANGIAYINVDTAVSGTSFTAQASPVLKNLLYIVTQQVSYPHSNETVYDVWLRNSQSKSEVSDMTDMLLDDFTDIQKKMAPPVGLLGSGSDYTAFMAHAGVSSLSMAFSGSSGAYHSNYDSPKRLTTFIDPDMRLHQAMVRIWGLVVIKLADDPVIDLNPVSYAKDLRRYIKTLEAHVSKHLNFATGGKNIDHTVRHAVLKKLHHLRAAQRQFTISAHMVQRDRDHLRAIYGDDCQMKSRRRHASCIKLRSSINDRAFSLERHLIDPEGIPGREWFKHVLVSPGRWMGYGAQVFPALSEAAEDGDWRQFQLHAKHAAETIHEAAWFLREV
ncbi:Vacuolar protein sorting-associated protein 70 [Coemansia sp. RSA 2703]|nr:Vacuolar protein sorting-associated protein 70 [Coemansia sp. RSA 2703]KAJ2368868.1 Vacuolar protein sorting-associated protein 70 [Coemansia sp. RSA 2607]KAJ2390480.1 Vacuolar protein sorting-associated protein 70 [Coemansia sp. RSA 2603]